MKIRFNRWYNAVLTVLLSMLGFGCSSSEDPGDSEIISMYGAPTANYVFKGTVTDEAGTPVQGIKTSLKNVYDWGDRIGIEGIDSVLTGVSGDYQIKVLNKIEVTQGITKIIVEDIDGESNGEFLTDTIDIAKDKAVQTKMGDGNMSLGTYEITQNIRLKKNTCEGIVIDPDGIIDNQFSEEYHTESFGGYTYTYDESNRIVRIDFYNAETDQKDKLDSCPSSFDDIKHLFPMSEGNEVRIDGTTKTISLSGDTIEYGEIFQHYYKDIPVDHFNSDTHYLITPKGKRMIWARTSAFFDIKDLDPTPKISEQQAREIFANYQNVSINDFWQCNLKIKEYSTRKNGVVVRKHVLVYDIANPYDPYVLMQTGGFCETEVTIPYALIDAHTGHIIAGYKITITQ